MGDKEIIYAAEIWSVKQGKEEEFLKIWTDLANWTKANEMCNTGAVLLQDLEQKNRFISFGPWKTPACVQAWRQQPEFKAAFVKLKELCDEIKLSTMKNVFSIP
ncbi:MAG: antibiotic biosynthesis monooxygenase family protein [Methanosarcina flavescens]|jgi:quinol monooxygenase YgiN|uniref:Antibiotic biosynthesis monooxygenase n=1 Tax=Methanosarcina flavescens TaxID=1715806 RepID=A0A660HQM3_9EURY|nr:antibiotic biosynthesis monooxygenase family protein [Methanosarcina flavescens]AYK14554.1 antibiotic biosynthesis monooxygenase [Methanosarcina flavescens]NLK33014.1 antibiotic biosynthesis monooxygenase [Methanosarcina flavescens]